MPALAQAALSPAERRLLDRFVAAAEDRLGGDLISVWLFGSRARGEATGPLSDVDLLVVTREGRKDRDQLWDLASRLAEEEGLHPYLPQSSGTLTGWPTGGRSAPSSCRRSTATRSCCTGRRER